MNAKRWANIPRELFNWITFLAQSLPARSVRTFIELLIGAMLTPAGFVTEAYLMLDMRNHWTSYYKWLQKGKWSWLALVNQFLRLALSLHGEDVIHLAIDDTLTLRASKKAPASQIHHQHGNKANLAKFVRGQCFVSLAMVVKRGARQFVAIPLLNRLSPSAGNTGKLRAAQVLIRAIYQRFLGKPVRVLMDSWYMRQSLIETLCGYGFAVIGQVRIDTRLCDSPPPRKPGQRGRPRKYGDPYTPKRIAHLKRTEVTLWLHGREQKVRYRSKVLMARFLSDRQVRAVWCEYWDSKKQDWKAERLLLSTDISLTAEEVIDSYSRRWAIETLFHELKQSWGMKEAWQQTRQVLSRWVHITSIGYGLIQLLALAGGNATKELSQISPWRSQQPITAGRVRQGLARQLRHVNVRGWWNATCRKFEPPNDEFLSDIG
ncbi:transposase [Microbulbifer thermotolerans]|uniref:IS701 family transposase n=1 Tax=Microbulbifer thermotolerans TaxID=252514 RepID=UPI00224B2401|nr:transposase [Microbulbifer thermotolerans]MCX2783198.1 transposase [Microbulbifer thermotolerans]